MPSERVQSNCGPEAQISGESKNKGQRAPCNSLHGAVAMAVTFEGEASTEKRKKRRKESRPESIIVYRSGTENKVEEEQAEEDGIEKSSEEGSKFLGHALGDGKCVGISGLTFVVHVFICSDGCVREGNDTFLLSFQVLTTTASSGTVYAYCVKP